MEEKSACVVLRGTGAVVGNRMGDLFLIFLLPMVVRCVARRVRRLR